MAFPINFYQFTANHNTLNNKPAHTAETCQGRGKSYCLIHRRYFETSWCPDCSRSSFH
ncbi:hypothetical protein BDB01DRAFT_772003 [Pilobolus umbonatus]|nr:hypothetical protein BDB01DRAFT_772003 [Pilobolus umbonatus]